MSVVLWQQCIDFFRYELPSQQFNTWIRPLQVEEDPGELRLYAPNRFVLDWVNDKYLNRIQELLDDLSQGQAPLVSLLIGSRRSSAAAAPAQAAARAPAPPPARNEASADNPPPAVPRAQATTQGFQPEPGPYGKRNEVLPTKISSKVNPTNWLALPHGRWPTTRGMVITPCFCMVASVWVRLT